MPEAGDRPWSLAVFTDTYEDINGVSTIYRQFVAAANTAARPAARLTVFTLSDRNAMEAGPQAEVLHYRPRPRLAVPGYPKLYTGYPPRGQIAADFADRGFDAVLVATPGPVGFRGHALARRAGLPLIGFYHTRFPAYLAVYSQGLGPARYVPTMAERVGYAWMRRLYGDCDLVICQSAIIADEVRQVSQAPIAVWDTGVDLAQFGPGPAAEVRARYGIPPEPVVVCYVGRLAPEKGLQLLVDLSRELPELPFLVVGDGPFADTLRAESGAFLTGFLRGEDLAEAYRAGDLFLFPSVTDTFGNVLLEAMASGQVLVVAEPGPGAELVARSGAGLSFPAGDRAAARAAIEALVGDPERRRHMAELGLAHARTRSWPEAFERFVALCRQPRPVLSRRSQGAARRRLRRMAVRLSRGLTVRSRGLDYPRLRGGLKEQGPMVECLECGAELVVPGTVRLGDTLNCLACGESFVVVEVSPLEIDYPDEDEDWDAWGDEDWDDGEDEVAAEDDEAED